MNTHHTKLKGDTAVSYAIYDLTNRGYYVFLPVSEHCPFDLVCSDGSKCFRIQVKFRTEGTIPLRNIWNDKKGTHAVKIDTTAFDFFALFDGYKICYPPSSMVGKTIRFELPSTFSEFHWYEDYLDFSSNIKQARKLKDFGITHEVVGRTIEFKSDSENTKPPASLTIPDAVYSKKKNINLPKPMKMPRVSKQRKVAWPSKEELSRLVFEKPTIHLAKEFGVSDKAVEKWCKIYNIKKPDRGYWARKKAGKI